MKDSHNLRLKDVFILFLLGTIFALLWSFVIFPRFGAIHQVFDFIHLGEIGENIYSGKGFSLDAGLTMRRAPLYPALIALVFHVFGFRPENRESSYVPVVVLQCILAGGTCAIVYLMAADLFGRKTGITAGLLCSIWPQCLRYLPAIDVEATNTFALTLLAYFSLRFYRNPSLWNGILCGVVVGTASLIKPLPVLYPILLAFLFIFKVRSERTKYPIAGMLACCVMVLVICVPWIVRNIMVSEGRFTGISSNASGEFLRGYVNARPEYFLLRKKFQGSWDWDANLYESKILQEHGLSFFSYHDGKIGSMPDSIDNDLQKEKVENAYAKKMVLHHPFEFIRKFVIQLFTFWYIVETPAKSLLVGFFSLIAIVLAIRGSLLAREAGISVVPLIAFVLYFNVLYAAILALARYSMPIFPTLLVMSACGISGLDNGLKTNATLEKTI
jgi:4-amino-4-deoxy-L-arabinose transferase-like glycosyltransferase